MYTLTHLLNNGQLKIDKIKDKAKSIYYISGLSTSILDSNHKILAGFGAGHDVFHHYPDITDEFKMFYQGLRDGHSPYYLMQTSYEFSFVVCILQDKGQHYGTILIGPFLVDEPSEHAINEIIKTKGLSIDSRQILKTLYDHIPHVSTKRIYYIEKTLSAIISMTNDTSDTGESALDIQTSEPSVILDSEDITTGYDYSFERLLLGKISNGDLDQVISMFHDQVKIPYLSMNTPQQMRTNKDNAIIYNTLVSRAAIEGGVDPDHSLAMAATFTGKIETIDKVNQLVDLLEDITIQYTNSVLHVASINHVSVIKKASRYVHNHLSEPIRLQEVADYVGLSPNYFSSLFKKEMHLAFADYVNHTRIKESQFLLQTTNHSILDIAISVGFNNQNYFTTIFKKTTGITPKQYRMRAAKK